MYEIKEYAGLIRNHKALSEELDVDTAGLDRESREKAIMEAAYSKWGHDLGNHINGQFAAIFEDTETGDIFATRDVLGAELLFFYEADTALICSTAITYILDHPLYTPQVNEELVPIFLQFTYVPGEHTLFKDIEKVEPGGWLSYTDGHLELGKYWTLSFDPQEDKDLDQWADEIEETMKAGACGWGVVLLPLGWRGLLLHHGNVKLESRLVLCLRRFGKRRGRSCRNGKSIGA